MQKMVMNPGIPEEIAGLFSEGAVNFEYISQFIDPKKIDSKALKEIKKAVSQKILQTMILGCYGDLRGARGFMKKLGMQTIPIPKENIDSLNEALKRLSEGSLILLDRSQITTRRKLGDYYLVGAREVLASAGYSTEELTDSKVTELLTWRYVLMQLKVNKISNVESWHKLLDGKITGDGIICLGTVRTVAARVIKEARGTVSGLLDLVPEEILDTELTEENLDWVRQRIKMIQSAKTNDFRQIIGLNNPKNNLSKKKKLRLLKKRLGLPLGYGYLPVKQENKKREIRFLMYLASEVGYQ